MKFPIEVPAIRVEQPLGIFFVATLPANVLLRVAYSDVMSAVLNSTGDGYVLTGTQRQDKQARLPQIGAYIDRSDSAFPNSIILAANFREDTGLTEDDETEDDDEFTQSSATDEANTSWSIVERDDGCFRLRIPTAKRLAAIIDGQHRLFGFTRAHVKERLEMSLLCSIYLDLPQPFQAQLFATINSTQKPVDKSLTYELFGYNIAEEEAKLWTPDKLAVFLTRKLATEAESPLRGRIIVAPKRDESLDRMAAGVSWKISTAAIVEGILRLYSSNPKRDSNYMLTPEPKDRSSLKGLTTRDKSPLRSVYLDVNDKLIYTITLNYLKACKTIFWDRTQGSFITKTVGVQALFDILRKIVTQALAKKDIRVTYFEECLRPAQNINFSADRFRNASGSGRSIIRRELENALGISSQRAN